VIDSQANKNLGVIAMHLCATCGRRLKDRKSIERGYGPVCYKKHLKALSDKEFEKRQLTIDEVMED
jgi:Family of unknown function (DUF6011)